MEANIINDNFVHDSNYKRIYIKQNIDYEEKYKKTLEKARKELQACGSVDCDAAKQIFRLFSELAESEDEKIRKELIEFLGETIENVGDSPNKWTLYNAKKWRAWLEKQDSHYTFEIKMGHWYTCVCDYMLNGSDLMFKNGRLYYCRRDWRLIGEIDERNVKDIGVNGYKSFFRPATNQEIKDWLENDKGEQSIQNVPSRETILNIWDLGNEWKELTSGSISTEHGTQLSYIQKHWQEGEYYLRAKQGEQKPADKVEPKFHKGDWTVSKLDRKARQISEVHFDDYNSYYVVNGKSVNLEEYDRLHRLWTIQDAKDGDVLNSPSYHLIWIYKDNENYHACVNMNYVTENVATNGLISIPNDACPATKDERTILFSNVEKSGYEWDAEKKQLKLLITNGGDFFESENCEQKHADKPKFKVGDLVAISKSDGEKVVQIDSIEYFKSGEPRYITSEGRWFGNGTKAHIVEQH